MSRYCPGDVILARVRIGKKGEIKARPALVIYGAEGEDLRVYPISHTPSWDQPFTPLALHDFKEGGLDIMDESYVLTGQVQKIGISAVIGKKGRLSREAMEAICPESGSL